MRSRRRFGSRSSACSFRLLAFTSEKKLDRTQERRLREKCNRITDFFSFLIFSSLKCYSFILLVLATHLTLKASRSRL